MKENETKEDYEMRLKLKYHREYLVPLRKALFLPETFMSTGR